MNIEREYERFSRWCTKNPNRGLDPRLHTHSGKISDGGYISHGVTSTAFKAWRAGRQEFEGEPDLVWDYDNQYESGDEPKIIAGRLADQVHHGESQLFAVACAKRLPNRTMEVSVSDESDLVWKWVDSEQEKGK